MEIVLPASITQQKHDIQEVQILFKPGTRRINMGPSVVQRMKPNFILSITDDQFIQASQVTIDVYMTSGNKWSLDYDATTKSELIFVRPVSPIPESRGSINVRRNHDTIYDLDDKPVLCSMLRQMNDQALGVDNQTRGTKNLIYYVVGHNTAYVDLLERSVQSIKRHATVEYDVLVITDDIIGAKVKERFDQQGIVAKYFLVDKLTDGITCSMLKTTIFQYPDINQYNKILFLDCDVICKRDVSNLFNLPMDPGVLYTVSNPQINTGSFKTLFHGLLAYTDQQFDQMVERGQKPFNAGQFLMLNSPQMAAHFDNVNWLIDVWPDHYFFEQSFMNHYFCLYTIADSALLSDQFDLLVSNEDITQTQKLHRDETTFIHFVAPALKGDIKLAFIDAYTHANQL